GFLSIEAGNTGTVNFTVTLSDTAHGTGFLSVDLRYQATGARAAKVASNIVAAILGMPEVKPVPNSLLASAGTATSMSYQVHSTIGVAEAVDLFASRTNPDPNNLNALFTIGVPPASVNLPAGGTVTVSVPTTLSPNAYPGNLNGIILNVISDGGVSPATGDAIVSGASGLLPTALVPVGLTGLDGDAADRDGSVALPARGYRLLTTGIGGVRVMRDVSTDSIGPIDADGDGVDDRVLGTIRIPAYAAALAVIPGFVSAAGETLDVGLVAAGRGGLMIVDLRTVEDPTFGTWEDFFDVDMNGIDDRILRIIPLSGFATDVAWFRTPLGRTVALVADADSGSVPVSASYNPAQVTAGTGQGVVAIDIGASLDFAGNPSFAAGTLATPGTTLDLELRGGSSPDLAVADGAAGVSVYGLSTSGGVPAIVTFTPRGSVSLSSAWGLPYARDLAWVSNTKDSVYVAVAASAGGVQLVRVPPVGGDAPSLVLVQQTLAPAIGLASAWTGTLAVAEGLGGVALLRSPGAGFLNQIMPAAAAPFTAPVTLARGAPWAATGSALEVASHQTPSGIATALAFHQTTGPIPEVLLSDGARLLVLRPGTAPITAVDVEPSASPAALRLRLSIAPNPVEANAGFVAQVEASLGSIPWTASVGPVRFEIFDVRGRLVRGWDLPPTLPVRVEWDGRDADKRHVASGRYWARATTEHLGNRAVVTSFLVLR
ncbi:MAG: hypothetical protein ACRENN_02055, partial [Candidatus Eiseniibacteriota bacterium]